MYTDRKPLRLLRQYTCNKIVCSYDDSKCTLIDLYVHFNNHIVILVVRYCKNAKKY